MRRSFVLLLAAAASAPLLHSPAQASVYCGPLVGDVQAFGPLCAVKCTLKNPPVVDPSYTPPAYLPDASCYYED
jgi:hypothetical protein